MRACAYLCLCCVCCVCKHTCACMCVHTRGPRPACVRAVCACVRVCAGSRRPCRPGFGVWRGVSAHVPGHAPTRARLRVWHETVCRGVRVHTSPATPRREGPGLTHSALLQGHPVYPHGVLLGPPQPTWSWGGIWGALVAVEAWELRGSVRRQCRHPHKGSPNLLHGPAVWPVPDTRLSLDRRRYRPSWEGGWLRCLVG